jgi:hypothetical protein
MEYAVTIAMEKVVGATAPLVCGGCADNHVRHRDGGGSTTQVHRERSQQAVPLPGSSLRLSERGTMLASLLLLFRRGKDRLGQVASRRAAAGSVSCTRVLGLEFTAFATRSGERRYLPVCGQTDGAGFLS